MAAGIAFYQHLGAELIHGAGLIKDKLIREKAPESFDRVLGTRFGVEAMAAAAEGDFGRMVALRGTRIERVPLAEALAEPKLVDPELYETAEVFFG